MKNIFTLFMSTVFVLGCQKEISNQRTLALPIITTAPSSAINSNSALSGGNITSDGGDSVTQRGICWDTVHNPIITNSHTSNGTGIGTFVSPINGLQPATKYYIRAYATNSVGTAYGNEESFTTSTSVVTLPTLTTTPISELFSTTAKGGGTITADGGAAVTVRGVCWSTTANPTVTLSTKTTDGVGVGTYISNILNLTNNTTYFIRAYATNSAGTAYGNELTFTTSPYTVYVVGTENDGTASPYKLWKNGVVSSLNIGIEQINAPNSIYVTNNNDVYIAGTELTGTNKKAVIWKNGTISYLNSDTSTYAIAHSVFADGNDIYACGICRTPTIDAGTIWKNGVGTVVNNSVQSAYPWSIFVNGNDVYAVGYEWNINYYQAKQWKNGVASVVAGAGQTASAFSVFVSNNNVFIAGYESNGNKNIAMIWKNGVGIPLGDGINSSIANAVFVVGNDVYAAGYESKLVNNVAVLWKNGVKTELSTGTNNAYARSLFVYGNDVFVVGEESNQAKLWKNGIATTLSNGTNAGYAYSIFVK
ncbi:MAG TPA: hypothetical protein PKD42_17100 [Chitinophagaceae bacterium]|jgi:sulfur transfer complex TusBCD TusB component (DsrH family)|nr:hypothetical protein [Chitinophagaceae bacterium]